MGRPELDENHKNPTTKVCGRRRLRRPDLTAAGWKILLAWSSGRPPPSGRHVYNSGVRNRLPRLEVVKLARPSGLARSARN